MPVSSLRCFNGMKFGMLTKIYDWFFSIVILSFLTDPENNFNIASSNIDSIFDDIHFHTYPVD